MASLNTLRTRFGIVLSVIIALALLAFILSLKTEMGFSGQDPRVGVIGGHKINYSEYYDEYERMRARAGGQERDERQSAMLADAAWQSLVAKHVLMPGFDDLGLAFTESERLAMVSGERMSQTFYGAFADPRTGAYDVAAVSEFLAQAESDPQAQQAWAQLNEQARLERRMQKYFWLVRGGAYVNSLEAAAGAASANGTFAGEWAGKRYASVPDSLFTVAAGEVKSYYRKHRNRYRQTPSRTISYVVFEVAPTDEDLAALERTAAETGAAFAAADGVRTFVRGERNGRLDERYLSASQLPADEAEALLAGRMYGPVLKNNEWTMARVVDARMIPDSLGIRHIVLPYTEEALADSLLTVLRGGAEFAPLAARYSVYEATAADGGDAGVYPFSAFTGAFAEALADARRGDVVKVADGDAIQLIQVYRADKPVKHVQVASIVYPLEASEATRRAVHGQAGSFMVGAKGSAGRFADAAVSAALTPRMATIAQGERTVRGLEDSRELVRWACGADEGDVSEIFTVGDDYVVATLTEIDDEAYTPLEKVAAQIRSQLLRDKKYDYIVNELSGATLAEQAGSLGTEPAAFEGVTYGSFYLDGAGVEPRLIGAIAATTEPGAVSAPVKGASGVYVFRVDDIAGEEKQTPEGEKVRAQAVAESMLQQFALQAVDQMAEIEDLRGRYF